MLIKPVTRKLNFNRRLLLTASVLMAVAAPSVFGQENASQSQPQSPMPDWQKVAGGKQEFDVASIKQNKSLDTTWNSNVPLGPADVYPSNGGRLTATNVPLAIYISFAYKLTGNQMKLLTPHLPKVALERFDINALATSNPTKDQMRLMMQSLLADRFKLAVHTETQQGPVFALVLVKPGKIGPQLKPHEEDPLCDSKLFPSNPSPTPPQKTATTVLPPGCFTFMANQNNGRLNIAGRKLTMQQIADSFSAIGPAALDRPVLDQTGLNGQFNFTMEMSVSNPMSPEAMQPGSVLPDDPSGPSFLQALKDQLGLKLESKKGQVQTLIIDHLEKPSEN